MTIANHPAYNRTSFNCPAVFLFLLAITLIFSPIYTMAKPQVLESPLQLKTDLPAFRHSSFSLMPLATFKLRAKVLGNKTYYFDRESSLVNSDLALGWGRMSDDEVLEQINIYQSDRWYRWEVKEFPIPRREIETHSANMHMIASNDIIDQALLEAKEGDIVEVSGLLVEVEDFDGWQWRSSTTRLDVGQGACELIYVESFRIE